MNFIYMILFQLCSYSDVRTHIKLNNVVIVKISCFVPCLEMKIVVYI